MPHSRTRVDSESIPQGEADKKVFTLLQDLGNSHPAYAYAILGTAAGGYVSWPADWKASPKTKAT
jgi:methyl-accepting chemotaxis protein